MVVSAKKKRKVVRDIMEKNERERENTRMHIHTHERTRAFVGVCAGWDFVCNFRLARGMLYELWLKVWRTTLYNLNYIFIAFVK